MNHNWKIWIKTRTRNNILSNFFGVKERNSIFIYHILKRAPSFPTIVSAETDSTGTQVIITFNKDMSDPAGKQSQFGIKV